MVPSFSAGIQARRRPPLATCSVVIAVCWCPKAAAPHTYCGSRAAVTTRVETARGRLYDLDTALSPRTALCQGANARSPFSRACQGRGGAAHMYRPRRSPYRTAPARRSTQRGRLRVYGLCALVRSKGRATVLAEPQRQAPPRFVQGYDFWLKIMHRSALLRGALMRL